MHGTQEGGLELTAGAKAPAARAAKHWGEKEEGGGGESSWVGSKGAAMRMSRAMRLQGRGSGRLAGENKQVGPDPSNRDTVRGLRSRD